MATITLRQANVVSSVGGTVKGSPLTNAEVDNNFANINVQTNENTNEISNVTSNVGVLTNLTTTATDNIVVAINEVRATAVANDPIPFAIALG